MESFALHVFQATLAVVVQIVTSILFLTAMGAKRVAPDDEQTPAPHRSTASFFGSLDTLSCQHSACTGDAPVAHQAHLLQGLPHRSGQGPRVQQVLRSKAPRSQTASQAPTASSLPGCMTLWTDSKRAPLKGWRVRAPSMQHGCITNIQPNLVYL